MKKIMNRRPYNGVSELNHYLRVTYHNTEGAEQHKGLAIFEPMVEEEGRKDAYDEGPEPVRDGAHTGGLIVANFADVQPRDGSGTEFESADEDNCPN